MNVTIRKIGNSEGIIIPKEVLQKYGLKAGDELKFEDLKGSFALTPHDAALADQMEAAHVGMERYRAALRELAK
nr:AbrB/MazE/SpoVT family DNA-binding domain-containing protein [uncultured Gellertiella sp.]